MKAWEKNELECCDYLNRKYGFTGTIFESKGGADSTQSDIFVKKNNKGFFIEAKMKVAQCTQFVLFPNYEKSVFVFSDKNKTKESDSCRKIIDIMNAQFSYFSSSAQLKPLPSDCDSCKLYAEWIIECYKAKKTNYIITQNDGEFVILPLEKLLDYFSVSAVYRVKKSGSSDPTPAQMESLISILKKRYTEVFVKKEEKHYQVYNCPNSMPSITKDGYEYLFRNDGKYYTVRRLSNTYNSNVIFSIKLKKRQEEKDLNQFVDELRSL